MAYTDTPSSTAGATIPFNSAQGLNPNLFAEIYEVEANENGEYIPVAGTPVVRAPISGDASIEYALNWQSPFENTAESSSSNVSAMLQSGYLQPFMNRVMGFGEGNNDTKSKEQVSETLKYATGRTGITKLNSTQTFAGMPPVKIPLTLFLQAFKNAASEVEAPLAQLINWALPVELSQDGFLAKALQVKAGNEGQANQSSKSAIQQGLDVLLPSKAPTLLALKYKGKTYKPMVIEVITDNITSPSDANGKYVALQVPITLCSLKAWDRADMDKARLGGY